MATSPAVEIGGYERAAASSFRLARFSVFLDLINSIPMMDRPLRILDVGGVEAYWRDKRKLIARPVEITLFNLDGGQLAAKPGFVFMQGNACQMPEFTNNSFDVIHSNSVIEHVGQWSNMMSMAKEIRRIAPRYFVQTPYFWFPVEPHARTPLLHWLPESLKFRVVMAHKCGPYWSKAATVDEAMRTIQDSSLLDKRMFSALFPDATIISEKFLGMTKSLMAVRKNPNITPNMSGQ
ncbi:MULTISPECIES: methyltransferase domain-containing protein [unclassified Bradyrhizobium]|uniref:methyltransferase domain-containing protein n=1 Tax=unclassified Bradyrhizobium TaxID=2631580 RepID=UPI001FF8A863|nr:MULTISPECIES: methyltransferase domain-containing protein [unclassified Bradyrhizobium]